MAIKISDVKNIIHLIVDDQKVVFITIWPTAHQTGIIVELAYGPKVALIRRGNEFNLVKRFKEIGVKMTQSEADHMGWLINQHLEIF